MATRLRIKTHIFTSVVVSIDVRMTIQQAKNKKDSKGTGSNGMVLTCFRSAVPAHIAALGDLGALHKHYWKYASTEFNTKIRANAKHPNSTFLTLEDEATIHYGTDTLLGFHLATAYAPLDPDNPLFNQIKGIPQLEKVVASYRTHATGIKVRFLIGDAASFAHTLHHRRITEASTACWYRDQCRDQCHLKPLVLDGPDYTSGIAPLAFDVIDTSNFCDNFGSLILLTATSTLLRNQVSSVLCADVLAKHHKSYKEILENMLCGHVPTLSTLLGLFTVEYWTNTSPLSSGDEGMLDLMMEGTGKIGEIESHCCQMFLRTCWKRPICMEGPSGLCAGLMTIQFDAGDLAHALFQVYLYMFLDEDNVLKFANISLEGILKSSQV